MNRLKNLSYLEVNNCQKYFIINKNKNIVKWLINKIISKCDIIVWECYIRTCVVIT